MTKIAVASSRTWRPSVATVATTARQATSADAASAGARALASPASPQMIPSRARVQYRMDPLFWIVARARGFSWRGERQRERGAALRTFAANHAWTRSAPNTGSMKTAISQANPVASTAATAE